ncbi:hypothetical protein CEXT_368801 [Caerostris extrusa]|uniref:Uncharacterized protein n=1 Tax=Caerostris extrusa TaxID=172846 RepID=A0AAV4QB99_CAEEX|nr:hypothetical protein CEXT_368801 [Caerostris extrusa]
MDEGNKMFPALMRGGEDTLNSSGNGWVGQLPPDPAWGPIIPIEKSIERGDAFSNCEQERLDALFSFSEKPCWETSTSIRMIVRR